MKTNDIILKMINENRSVTEIAKAVNLSNKQLFYRLNLLKNKGYMFNRRYYYNGDITYKIDNKLKVDNNDFTPIFTKDDDNIFNAVFISDLHLGSFKDRIDLLKVIYDYCKGENINIIINAGDFIDGHLGSSKKRFYEYDKQVEYAIKCHPYDEHILNFLTLGNHDLNAKEMGGIDVAEALTIRRHDIVPLGYGIGIVKIKNDEIVVTHPGTKSLIKFEDPRYKLVLSGHHHKVKFLTGYNNSVQVQIPTLSNLLFKDYNIAPGAVKAKITFKYGFFETGLFTNLIIENNKVYTGAELQCYMLADKDCKANNINYIDKRNIKKKIK